MSIRVTCAGCGKVVKAGDDWLGRSGKCPGCGAAIQFAAELPAASAPSLAASRTTRPLPSANMSDSSRLKRSVTPNLPMSAEGVNGQLTLLDGRIRISRTGVLAFLTQGLKGDKEIQLSSIFSIQWKAAGVLTRGYIQFAFYGGAEAKGGLWQATEDENSILFTSGQQPEFEAIRDEIQRRLNQRDVPFTSGSASIADEIRKLAELRDEGILTPAEFEAKKRQLLGI